VRIEFQRSQRFPSAGAAISLVELLTRLDQGQESDALAATRLPRITRVIPVLAGAGTNALHFSPNSISIGIFTNPHFHVGVSFAALPEHGVAVANSKFGEL
jgi:hypothetical protein